MTANELHQAAQYFDKKYPKEIQGFSKISSRVLNMCEVKALEYVYSMKRLNKPFHQKLIMIVKNNKNYVLTFTSPTEDYFDFVMLVAVIVALYSSIQCLAASVRFDSLLSLLVSLFQLKYYFLFPHITAREKMSQQLFNVSTG